MLKRVGSAGAAAIILITALLTSCAGGSHSGTTKTGATKAGAAAEPTTKVAVSITPEGCAPEPPNITVGAAEFDIENKNADAVSEAALRSTDGKRILGEKDHLTPGESASFTRTLSAGSYEISCPGAQQDTWNLRVTAPDSADSWHDNAELVAAVKGYADWVQHEIGELAANTGAFVAAVKAGRIEPAKILYAKARVGYERVEPVAESFGNLDKEIDGRINDFVNPANFSGFHRLERALFTDKSVTGMAPIADRLLENVEQLHRLVETQEYTPIELASGATDLVNEIEESKITGEEERYSGVDLIDFRGNLDGALELVHELTPFLEKNAPTLLATIKTRNAAVEAALATYVAHPGFVESGYVNYSTVTDPERRQLSAVINPLAEEISDLVVVVSK